MARITPVEVKSGLTLDDYAENALLAPKIAELRSVARAARERLAGRRLWMVNSAERGGGVAEMLPKQVSLLSQLGIETRWVVIGCDEPRFFELTKRLHNLIHSSGDPQLGADDHTFYTSVSRELAQQFKSWLEPEDIVIVHDPQPAGMAAALKSTVPNLVVWRCHIGLEVETPATDSAWSFLEPYLKGLDHFVFSSTAYIPQYLSKNVSIIRPAIDPLAHKNRELHPVKLAGVLTNAGLMQQEQPVLTPSFARPVTRLGPNGRFEPMDAGRTIGLMFRPTLAQVSRWDRLKGWRGLLDGFVRLKQNHKRGMYEFDERCRRRLEIVRLILAGPEPDAVQDDPEAKEVLEELSALYQALSDAEQRDIAIISLPMQSVKENALIVNALQRCSSVVVQNSLQEGFGLVVTEAMWKRTPVLGSMAYGIRQQIRDGIDGLLVLDPKDPEAVEAGMLRILESPHDRATWARSAQRRVYDESLIFRQLVQWLELLVELVARPAALLPVDARKRS